MKGAIGSLLWLWSQVERELTAAIGRMNGGDVPKSAHGLSRSIDVWSKCVLGRGEDRGLQIQLCQRLVELLTDALAIRNLVCHGLIDISGQFHQADCEAHLVVKMGDDRRILTWSALQEMFAWMSRTKWLIGDLTAAAMENDAARGNARLVGWEDFPRHR